MAILRDRGSLVRAIGELAIVFFGVTLGLLADDWRQNRGDVAAERLALGDILADLDADSAELENLRARAQAWNQQALWVLTAPSTGLPRDTIEIQVRRLTVNTYMQQVRSTYEGLVGAGRLGLIRDPDLRRGLVAYYELDQPYMRQLYDRTIEHWEAARSQIARYFALAISDTTSSLFPLRPYEMVESWEAFRSDPQTRIRLEALGAFGGNWATRIDPVLTRNGHLQEAIATYLEDQP